MRTGRPSQRQRSPFGARVRALRVSAGLSQQHVADQLGISQSAFALWERHVVALKPEQLTKLAQILRVRVEELLEEQPRPQKRGGPVGKAQRLFEAVSRLPRHQQEKIYAVLEPYVAQHSRAVAGEE
jgi:transcriptional regulator with XRE-family HTH domain